MFTIRLKNSKVTSRDNLPNGKICKITNVKVEGGYNEYNKSAFEDDGSFIAVINVKTGSTIEVLVKWEEDADFTTYTYTFEDATMQEA